MHRTENYKHIIVYCYILLLHIVYCLLQHIITSLIIVTSKHAISVIAHLYYKLCMLLVFELTSKLQNSLHS